MSENTSDIKINRVRTPAPTRAQRIEQLKRQLAQEIGRAQEEERKARTRKLCILGAAVEKCISDPEMAPERVKALLDRLGQYIRPEDRKAAGFSPTESPSAPGAV